jgi:hypothetical protein
MTWEQFTTLLAIILPVVTFGLGYVGSLYTESKRDRRERERVAVARRAEVEQEALLEVQSILLTLPTLYLDMSEKLAGAETVEAWDAAKPDVHRAAGPTNRALMLATRVIDDTLRQTIEETIGAVSVSPAAVRPDSNGEPYEYPVAGAWELVRRANVEIGERLRST